MKKIKTENLVILVMGIIIIVLVATIGEFQNIITENKESYEKRIDKLVEENGELSKQNYDLNENVYNMFEKKPYELTIKHDDNTITYKQDKFGLFDSYYKMTTYSSAIGE